MAVPAGRRQLVPSAAAFPLGRCSPRPSLLREGAGTLQGTGAPSPGWAPPPPGSLGHRCVQHWRSELLSPKPPHAFTLGPSGGSNPMFHPGSTALP